MQVEELLEERRIAIEAIAKLMHLKNDLYAYILQPAGVPLALFRQMARRSDALGRAITKRAMAPLILDAIQPDASRKQIERRVVEIAAQWDRTDLTDDPLAARKTVLMARGFLSSIADEEAKAEVRRFANVESAAGEQRRTLETQSALLLAMYDELVRSDDHQRRGFLLQDLLPRVLDLHDISVIGSFTRNAGGEQIDGAFRLDGWHYLVECRWRTHPADIRQMDGLLGQVRRSGAQTLGVFLAINGWSPNVVPLLKQNPEKRMLLMDGYDLRRVLADPLDLRALLQAKLAELNLRAEPFLSAREFPPGIGG